MASWNEMGQDCLRAARSLYGAGYYRSSVSRSYYAAYCMLTEMLVRQRVVFGRGWVNPPHEQLPRLIAGHLHVKDWQRKQVTAAVRRLRTFREDADYRPAQVVDRSVARICLQDGSMIEEVIRGHV